LPLDGPTLSVNPPSVGSCSLLLIGLLLLAEESGGDGGNQGNHVAPSRARESGVPDSAEGRVALIGGFLLDGVHR
jgi:hypothetical protein